jgi:hypothetical protein
MKKFYSAIKGTALAAILSINATAFSQPICGPIVENFNNTSGSTAGFIGDFVIGTSGSNGYLNKNSVIASGIYTITTPTYQLANNASYLGYGFLLDGSERIARVEAAIIYVSTLNNQMTMVFLSQFVPSYDQSSSPVADVCRAISLTDLPGFPTGGKYRFRFELTPNTGSGQAAQNLAFDDFRTNGTLAQAPLPVNFIGFDAKRASGSVQLTWKVAGEENVARYEVERSIDGRNFTTVATIATNKKDTYTYLDADNSGTLYYRIKNVDNDAGYKYSSIARLTKGKSEIVIKAFPQPVLSQLTVQHPTIKENSFISVSTADGRLVKSVKPSTGSMQTYVDMTTLQKGLYLVRFDDGNGNVETIKVLKQ